MIASDWGRWLIEAIEEDEVDALTAWYLGCNGLAVKARDGTIIYVDPYLGLGDPPRTVRMIPVPFDPDAPTRASALLVTHEHTDHLHGATQGPMLASTGATLYAPEVSIARIDAEGWVEQYDLEEEQVATVDVAETIDLGGLAVTVERCHDPDAEQAHTYVISDGRRTIAHCADGRPFDGLERIGETHDIDLAVAAVGSSGMIPDKRTRKPTETTWYNDANDVVRMASMLRADRLVPTHWDMWKGLTADPTGLIETRRSFTYPAAVEVLEIGDRIVLD
ncbi:MAG: MBL fold metallo-hydrolase [Halobacteriota archaeon]